ncbi:uncharacterized protein BCR38DRAFT_354178 [Pseudomassariella vexata]|uniref:Uncharacterized protein n=1 Tax=Pseudomassariella vexata TaxID=1141098 RepID=A0A1Y2DFB3_9PEZI|nr:uncharacterized protein BCR38DRAFT_354178 [Pseudomassariella vexata]ORY57887.1 hypothetical protein BCR38DRAFT_354178 [Pseudomassariella vexata]
MRWQRNVFNLGVRANGGILARPGVAQGPHPQTIQLQRVKIRRKWLKRAATAGVIYVVCYEVWTTSVSSVLTKFLKDVEPIEKEEDTEPLFIALPFTQKMVEPKPYRGSDPEWQAFAKFSRDVPLMTGVHKAVAAYAKRQVELHPPTIRACGQEIKVSRLWVEFQYPYKPPPTFERLGIMIDDEGISIASEEIDPALAFKINRALWPSALTQSLWSFSTALMKQNFLGVVQYLGFNPNPNNTSANVQQAIDKMRQRIDKSQQPMEKTESKHPSPNTLPQATKPQGAEGSSASIDRSSADTPHTTTRPLPTSGSVSPNGPPLGKPQSAKDIYGINQVSEHTSGPLQAFKKKFAQTWRPWRMPPNYPPRGSLKVLGMVELTGPRGKVVVDVFAWFNPATNTIDTSTIKIFLRSVSPKVQEPLRN